jgi:hypothetical protein
MPLDRVDHGRVLLDVVKRQCHQQHPRAGRRGQAPPLCHAFSQDEGTLRIIGHPAHHGADEHQVPGAAGHHMLGEAAHDTRHVLEPVPARDLHDNRVGRAGPAVARYLPGVSDFAGRPVAACEAPGCLGRLAVQDPDGGQDRLYRGGVEFLVLRGERVDRWRDDPGLCRENPRRHVLPSVSVIPVAP